MSKETINVLFVFSPFIIMAIGSLIGYLIRPMFWIYEKDTVIDDEPELYWKRSLRTREKRKVSRCTFLKRRGGNSTVVLKYHYYKQETT